MKLKFLLLRSLYDRMLAANSYNSISLIKFLDCLNFRCQLLCFLIFLFLALPLYVSSILGLCHNQKSHYSISFTRVKYNREDVSRPLSQYHVKYPDYSNSKLLPFIYNKYRLLAISLLICFIIKL